MKRFIQSSVENLNIDVNSISEIRTGVKADEFDVYDKKFEGYTVSVTTTYGRTVVLGVYSNEAVANTVAEAIKLASVKDMLEPLGSQQFQSVGLWVNYASSTVVLPASTEKQEPQKSSGGVVDISKIPTIDLDSEEWKL